jgi:hypothetical protein
MPVPYKLNYFEIETGIDSTSTFIHTGDFTATKLKKYLATSNDILLGDGTTTGLSGLQSAITLTTTGTSGVATLVGATLNIPNYGSGSGFVPYTGATQAVNLGAFDLTVNDVKIGLGGGSQITNTVVGRNSLQLNTTGLFNTAVGSTALNANLTGSFNIAIGSAALESNTSTSYNTAIGALALRFNNSGQQNTAIGHTTLYSNTLGKLNTAIGEAALYGNINGDNNVAIGVNAGSNITPGTLPNISPQRCIYIGHITVSSAGSNTNEIVIGASAIGNGSNTVTIGDSTITDNYLKGNVRGGAFIKTGGTSAQILAADGSVITAGTNITISAGVISASGGGGSGTVTSVAALTLGTSGTDLSSTVANSTTTPVITLNVPTASATNRGALSSTDWTTFNSKQGTITLTTTGSSGASSLIANTLNVPNYTLAGLGGVPTTRTITINGTSQDLSADRTFSVGTVTSVGLSMPSAFSVASSPITGSGTIAVTGAGLASQYIRGDGQLADFPTGGGGGGSSVSYYLNGSVNQGTFGGNVYKEMNKVPVLGAGTDFTINADGYIAQFLTDANDPNALLIPAGNWNFETYFSASSGGGSPSFYVELYKYDGATFTLIASNSAIPELISFGTTISPYFSSLAVPETVLLATDRLAIRVYVNHSSKTITLHTEGVHLCEVQTTFTTGLQALNGLTKQTQYFAVGTSGTDFAISSSVDTHTFNLPTASATNRGALSSANWSTFNGKQNTITLTTTNSSGSSTFIADVLNVPTYTLSGLGGVPTSRTITINGTSQDLSADRTYNVGTVTSVAALTLGTTGTDLSSTVANGTTTPVITLNVPTASATNRGALSSADWTTFNGKQNALTNPVTGTGTTNTLPKFTGASTIGDSAITDDGTTVTLVSRALSGTSATFSGTVTAANVNVTSSSIPANGMYLSVANTLNFSTNSTSNMTIGTTGSITIRSTLSLGNYLTLTSANTFIYGGTTVGSIQYGNSTSSTHLKTYGATHATLANVIQLTNNSVVSLTLAASGAATFASSVTATSASFSATSQFLDNTGASTTTKFIRIGNTSGDMAIGVEGDTPTQIASGSGGIAYSTVLKTVGATALILGTNSIAALTLNGSTQAATFSNTLGINGVANSVTSGTYTPTLTNVENIEAATASNAIWSRVGNTVTVYTQVGINPTTISLETQVALSLPVASNFTNSTQSFGNAITAASTDRGVIYSDNINDRVVIYLIPTQSSGNQTYHVSFSYQIL